MRNRYLNAALILIGISSGLIGNYSSSTPNTSKLLPPGFAFAIWGLIYCTGIYLAYKLIRNGAPESKYGISLISFGYLLSGLWIRFDGHPVAVAIVAVLTLIDLVAAIYFLTKATISRTLLNLLATFAGWITVATSLVIADASHISTASDLTAGIYLAAALTIAFALYLFLAPEYGYVGTIAWATFSLLFTRSVSGTPIFVVSAIGFLISVGLILSKAKGVEVLKSGM